MSQKEILKEIANEVDGTIYEEYSGRGMYGKTCIGIVCNNAIDCIESAAAKGITGAKTDNMGKSMIVYWPHIKE